MARALADQGRFRSYIVVFGAPSLCCRVLIEYFGLLRDPGRDDRRCSTRLFRIMNGHRRLLIPCIIRLRESEAMHGRDIRTSHSGERSDS